MAYSVARRTNEIGLRIALGASATGVGWMVLREVGVLAALGVGISVPVALAASRLVQEFLFEVEPNDPWTLAAAAGSCSRSPRSWLAWVRRSAPRGSTR
jgi:ABC-type antimicrobial peptide transport system permease subunit